MKKQPAKRKATARTIKRNSGSSVVKKRGDGGTTIRRASERGTPGRRAASARRDYVIVDPRSGEVVTEERLEVGKTYHLTVHITVGGRTGSKLRTPDEKRARALEIAGKRSARTVLHVSEMSFREPTQKEREIAESLIPQAKRALSEHGKRKAS